VFGIEVGNEWSYEGTNEGTAATYQRTVTSFGWEVYFPVQTYRADIYEDGVRVGRIAMAEVVFILQAIADLR